MACLVYDHRSWGPSDTVSLRVTAVGQPKYEMIPFPSTQMSDMRDAITYAQGLPTIEVTQVALWESSYSGGNVLQVTAIGKRVKAVISQVSFLESMRCSPVTASSEPQDKLQQQFLYPIQTLWSPRCYQVPKLLRSTLGGNQSSRESGRMRQRFEVLKLVVHMILLC
jgi:hypothetical protein